MHAPRQISRVFLLRSKAAPLQSDARALLELLELLELLQVPA